MMGPILVRMSKDGHPVSPPTIVAFPSDTVMNPHRYQLLYPPMTADPEECEVLDDLVPGGPDIEMDIGPSASPPTSIHAPPLFLH